MESGRGRTRKSSGNRPANEMSLIYYPNRGGIEDRVFRIKTDRSSATSLPEPRTGHNITNVEILSREGSRTSTQMAVRVIQWADWSLAGTG